jgi:hypothetical protein
MSERAAWTQHLRILGDKLAAPKSKYGAKPMVVGGIRFDSTKEARRYSELRLLEKAGQITDLETQPKFPIDVVQLWQAGRWTWRTSQDEPPPLIQCGVFTADFRYVETATGQVVIEDVKSGPTKTTAYRLRKRLVEAIHGVTISEV